MTDTDISPIHRAAQFFGSQIALAKALGISPVTVNQWFRATGGVGVRSVPPKRCVAIERLTQGAVTRQQLRPADWWEIWPELAQPPVSTDLPAINPIAEPIDLQAAQEVSCHDAA